VFLLGLIDQESCDVPKKRLSPERRSKSNLREDLRAIYPPLWSELTSRKVVYYQLVTILSGALAGLAFAGIQYKTPLLLAAVPPILVILLLSSAGYLVWRRWLIHYLANIERLLEIPDNCAYAVFEDNSLKKSPLPPFLRERSVILTLVASVILMILLEYLVYRIAMP
jgi:hypothetical protein